MVWKGAGLITCFDSVIPWLVAVSVQRIKLGHLPQDYRPGGS